jgi:hypothetical protein
MKDDFIAVLLVATLSCKTTIEHEFISVVLSLDGLQHPLLRGAPFNPIPETRKYEVSEAGYEVARGHLIESQLALVASDLYHDHRSSCFRERRWVSSCQG